MEPDNTELLNMLRKSREATAKLERMAGQTKGRDRAAMQAELDKLRPLSEVAHQEGGLRTASFGDRILAAGYDRKGRSAVVLEWDAPLVETKTASVDGGSVLANAVPTRYEGPRLGIDSRYLFPHVRTQGVDGDSTGVSTYKQKSRVLGTPADMIKDIDSTSAKEETDTTAEVVTSELKMVANVSSDIPNILLQNPGFAEWVSSDLLAGYRAALDLHITTAIAAASVPSGDGGVGLYESVLFAKETVRSAGYEPDLVVMSPGDALDLELSQLTSGVSYLFQQAMPPVVVTPAVADNAGFVADSQALGILFLGPFAFATFEENAGTTNSSTVRAESSALFVVQRASAAASFAAVS